MLCYLFACFGSAFISGGDIFLHCCGPTTLLQLDQLQKIYTCMPWVSYYNDTTFLYNHTTHLLWWDFHLYLVYWHIYECAPLTIPSHQTIDYSTYLLKNFLFHMKVSHWCIHSSSYVIHSFIHICTWILLPDMKENLSGLTCESKENSCFSCLNSVGFRKLSNFKPWRKEHIKKQHEDLDRHSCYNPT